MSQYYCNPINMEYRFQFVKHLAKHEKSWRIYREAADPSMICFKGKYYLFPSMTAGFLVSNDLINWTFHPFHGEIPIHDYAPDVTAAGDYLYFCASRWDQNCSFYRTRDPEHEPFEEIHGTFPFWDPNLFRDDDGRLYFYWGCSNYDPIFGTELNPDTMEPLTEPKVLLRSDKKNRGYERIGKDHTGSKTEEEIRSSAEPMIAQILSAPKEMREQHGLGSDEAVRRMCYSMMGDDPYIEGAWMNKHNGKYYLQYAIPGTEFNIYGDGVYVSDFPLGPFVPAQNNPYSYHPGGFMPGAGHGSTMEDASGHVWHVSTMALTCNDNMERRLGLWKAGFDADGELFCDQRYGDWPIRADAKPFEQPDWMLLSYGKPAAASSGAGAENITDENCQSWWKADADDREPVLTLDLGTVQEVHAVQLNFMEDGITADVPESGHIEMSHDARYIESRKQYTHWLLEGSADGKNYIVLADKREADTDLTHDLLVWEDGVMLRFLRLTITEMAYHAPACVSSVRVFGVQEGDLPPQTAGITLERSSPMDVTIRWKEDGAIGHNILWGCSPDKLYHSYMVYGKNEQSIGALVAGQPVWLRVDAFNACGITEGNTFFLNQ